MLNYLDEKHRTPMCGILILRLSTFESIKSKNHMQQNFETLAASAKVKNSTEPLKATAMKTTPLPPTTTTPKTEAPATLELVAVQRIAELNDSKIEAAGHWPVDKLAIFLHLSISFAVDSAFTTVLDFLLYRFGCGAKSASLRSSNSYQEQTSGRISLDPLDPS